MTSSEAQHELIGDLTAHLRLAAEMVEDPVLARAAEEMLARLTENKPLRVPEVTDSQITQA